MVVALVTTLMVTVVATQIYIFSIVKRTGPLHSAAAIKTQVANG